VEAVEAELLTQERADEIRENLDEALDKIVDMQFGFPWKRFNFDFDFRFHGEDEDAPGDASPAPQGGASDDIQRS
jgi:hypothetical protein